jgi:hypothetical protein
LFLTVSTLSSTDDLEGAVASATEPIDREIIIEACRPRDAATLHDGKTGPIGHRKILIDENGSDRPRGLQISACHDLDVGGASPQCVPKSISGVTVQASTKEQPSLQKNVIGCQERLAAPENDFRALVISVAAIYGGKLD